MSSQQTLVRTGYLGLVAVLVAVVIAMIDQFVVPAVPVEDTSYPVTPGLFVILEVVLVLFHIATFVLILVFARSGLAGRGRLARVSLIIALIGFGVYVFAEAGFMFAADTKVDDALPSALSAGFGVSTILIAVGMLLAGIATIRAGVWKGWGRFTPLAVGIVTVILLALVFSNDTRNWGLAAWCLSLGALALALTRAPKVA